MRILLDECVDWRLKNYFGNYNIKSVHDMNWLGKINGELLSAASENGFNIFITIDKRLRYQQNLKNYNLAIVVLDVRRNTLDNLRPLVPKIIAQLNLMEPGNVYEIQ